MTRIPRVAAAVVALALAAPAVAGASTVSYEGDMLVLRAAPGEANIGTVGMNGEGEVQISDTQPPASADVRCAFNEPQGYMECQRPARVRLELADGNDIFGFTSDYPADLPAEVYAGDGDDRINGYAGYGAAVMHLIDGGSCND
jgi:hypothetical protein